MSTKHKLILFPCNGNAIEAIECIDPNKYQVLGFVDDSEQKFGREFCGVRVFDRGWLAENIDAKILAIPGNPDNFRQRESIIIGFNMEKHRFATISHPKASISDHASIGLNTLLMAGVVITSNAMVGDHCCVLPNTVMHHDSVLGDYCLVGSNVTIAGFVTIGKNFYIGSGSKIRDNVIIGAGALIGIGSNVVGDIAPGVTVYGNPAKEMR